MPHHFAALQYFHLSISAADHSTSHFSSRYYNT